MTGPCSVGSSERGRAQKAHVWTGDSLTDTYGSFSFVGAVITRQNESLLVGCLERSSNTRIIALCGNV